MNIINITIATILLLSNSVMGATQNTSVSPESLNETTPVAITPKWVNERELTLLFENSSDRVTLARLIISECINNTSLTDLTRIDGLRIAGHICYRDDAPEDAILAFTELDNLTTTPRWKAEALRMLAQLSMGQGAINTSLNQFKTAWEYSILDDPEGRFSSTKSILNMICNLSDITNDHAGGLDYALQGIALFSTPTTQREKSQYVYWAYELNKELGDNVAALDNLNDLLENHPEFQAENDLHGFFPTLRLDVYNLQENGWNSPSEDFIHEIISVVYDPAYLFMPSRIVIIQKFGALLENYDNDLAAINFRSYLREELEDELATNATIDPFLKETLFYHSSILALDDAKLHIKLRDFISATATLNSLINSNNNLPAHIVDQATELNDAMILQMENI